MPLRSVPRALSVLTLALVACGPSPEAAPAKPTAEPVKSTTPAAAPTPAPAGGVQLSTNAPASSVADPSWFSPALLPGASVTKKGRSPTDDQGRFTSQILFAFPAGATLKDCVDPLAAALAKIVPTVQREEKDGRVTLTGDTAEQHVMFMCGDANGTLTSFVSYRWTQPPPAAP
ncbi:hypothetical protein [Nannocystis bainbridge]|uniref:Lipoprotein n=1 Tax=Nannocystis bainbridge TaxID=2995303 RepID=A0ABT5DVX4_9BACT|nr:hypothetical protein [Nannocystis bainbridge]MDC0717790.1 hypothetical protein [Nannocystis bainbridge]